MNPELAAQLCLPVNFPSPPGVAVRIIELAQDPGIEMGKVAKAISVDPALTIKILRIANSPLYAQRGQSESLRQALVVLGLNATLTLALSFSLVKSLRGNKSNGIDYPLYWRRALLTATSARALADALHETCAEEFFLAGLLQDIGMLALERAIPALYRDTAALQQNHAALAEYERGRLGSDHADVGAHALRAWNIPESLCRAIGNSHQITLAGVADRGSRLDRAVALAGPIADLFLGESSVRPFAETAQRVQRSVGLDNIAFGQILATIGAIIPETESLFDTRLLSKQQAHLILDQAREVLMVRSLRVLRDIDGLKPVAEDANSRSLDRHVRSLDQRSRSVDRQVRRVDLDETQRDALTGACNRAYLDQFLAREFEQSTRHGSPLSIACADLDNFALINDTYGHQAGDRILETTARILRDNTRETDLIARYGGEEFVLALPGTDAGTARRICERMVKALEAARHEIGAADVRITCSIGCATHAPQAGFADPAELIKAADRALCAAKSRGRNRAVQFESDLPQTLPHFGGCGGQAARGEI
jgi:diguanylate cyclase (GGDEF)-like protein